MTVDQFKERAVAQPDPATRGLSFGGESEVDEQVDKPAHRLLLGRGCRRRRSFHEEAAPGPTCRDGLGGWIRVGGNGAESDLGQQAVAAGPVGIHPLSGREHQGWTSPAGRLTEHPFDLAAGDQGVEVEPDGVRMDTEPVGDLDDRERGIRCGDDVRHQLSAARRWCARPPGCGWVDLDQKVVGLTTWAPDHHRSSPAMPGPSPSACRRSALRPWPPTR